MYRKVALCLLIFLSSALNSAEPRLLFLSFERSGTFWGLYCLSKILERDVVFRNEYSYFNPFESKKFDPEADNVILAAYSPYELDLKANSRDYLVVIVRNYRENLMLNFMEMHFVRAKLSQEEKLSPLDYDSQKAFSLSNHHYFNVLRCYDHWPSKRRFLIYYEDLVQNPERVLQDFLRWFKAENRMAKLEEFMKNFNQERSKYLATPQTFAELYNSEISDLLHFSKKIGFKDCQGLDREVHALFPYYFETYLQRYEITDPSSLK